MQGNAAANGQPQREALSQPTGRSASRARTSGVCLSCFPIACELLQSHFQTMCLVNMSRTWVVHQANLL